MQVDKIAIGTVVDHIKAGKAARVMKLFGIDEEYPHRVAIVMNVPSKKMGTKDIVKIEGKIISQEMANIIALISPKASVNIIKNSKVEKKYFVVPPQELMFGKCPNPNCISFEATPHFVRMDSKYVCHYCERMFNSEELF
ncbi:aspartate carbamoyltransferase regulatory subunit [Candidatus Micrarchaeota archaeon]|nr:aspartate carbamoyltransferase regulatory subunit [Candidatus Micrarchaeota archaeon]